MRLMWVQYLYKKAIHLGNLTVNHVEFPLNLVQNFYKMKSHRYSNYIIPYYFSSTQKFIKQNFYASPLR